MTAHDSNTYAVINADDFGMSSTVNMAVAEAHDRGLLTSASIMAGGQAFDDAVRIIGKWSTLSPGLHVTLCDGRAILPKSDIPDLVDENGYFDKNPARAWIRYSRAGIRRQLDAEIRAQFDRLDNACIHPLHVDSHHHLHMHPKLFSLVCWHASRRGVRWVRIPYEPLPFIIRFRNPERGVMPFLEWGVFRLLRGLNAKKAGEYGLRTLSHSYGISRTGHVEKTFLRNLFQHCDGFLELFTHPDVATETGRKELETLLSSDLRFDLAALDIRLVGYRELSEVAEKRAG